MIQELPFVLIIIINQFKFIMQFSKLIHNSLKFIASILSLLISLRCFSLFFIYNTPFLCFLGLCCFIQCRTGNDNPPVTFAIAACETQNVNVTVLPSFGLSHETNSVTAKDMWDTMVQVLVYNMTIWQHHCVVLPYFHAFYFFVLYFNLPSLFIQYRPQSINLYL